MKLSEQIALFKASRKAPPPEVVETMRRARAHIRDSGASGLREGERVPDFTLPNQVGTSVALADRLRKGPLVLSFYRGVW